MIVNLTFWNTLGIGVPRLYISYELGVLFENTDLIEAPQVTVFTQIFVIPIASRLNIRMVTYGPEWYNVQLLLNCVNCNLTCPKLICYNQGVKNYDNCSCSCPIGWVGSNCERRGKKIHRKVSD